MILNLMRNGWKVITIQSLIRKEGKNGQKIDIYNESLFK